MVIISRNFLWIFLKYIQTIFVSYLSLFISLFIYCCASPLTCTTLSLELLQNDKFDWKSLHISFIIGLTVNFVLIGLTKECLAIRAILLHINPASSQPVYILIMKNQFTGKYGFGGLTAPWVNYVNYLPDYCK